MPTMGWKEEKKKSADIQLQNRIRDLKLCKEFIHKSE
jgi:hypothetical protein